MDNCSFQKNDNKFTLIIARQALYVKFNGLGFAGYSLIFTGSQPIDLVC
jgi:hypothetical protein